MSDVADVYTYQIKPVDDSSTLNFTNSYWSVINDDKGFCGIKTQDNDRATIQCELNDFRIPTKPTVTVKTTVNGLEQKSLSEDTIEYKVLQS